MSSSLPLLIRPAVPGDAPVIAEFNIALARETESKQLDPEVVARGVAALLAEEHRGRYFVACDADRIVGQLMHTREWSDWRNGDIWWLQSVYVTPEYRGQGVFRRLLSHLTELAASTPQVVGLRLYVESHNEAAKRAYQKSGFAPGGYEVFERWPQPQRLATGDAPA